MILPGRKNFMTVLQTTRILSYYLLLLFSKGNRSNFSQSFELFGGQGSTCFPGGGVSVGVGR